MKQESSTTVYSKERSFNSIETRTKLIIFLLFQITGKNLPCLHRDIENMALSQ